MAAKKGRRQELFERVAMPHFDAVYNFGYSLTRNQAAAEDLVQETYLNAYRNFDGFRVGTNCKAWLFKICKNHFIDDFRARKRRPVHQEVDTAEPAELDRPLDIRVLQQSSAEGRAFEKHEIENESLFLDLFGDEINRFLKELPEEFRKSLLLCDLEGFRYEEIAELMGTPIGTVRSRISRGRALLRSRLEGYAKELGYLKESHQDCDERNE